MPPDIAELILSREFKNDHLRFDDPRLTQVVIGQLLQVIAFFAVGAPFCLRETCRFYNAHYQSHLIAINCLQPQLCDEHEALLKVLRRRLASS